MYLLSNFTFDKLDAYLVVFVVMFMLLIFKFRPTFPSIGTLQTTIELFNTKGGIILVLGGMSLLFFFTGLKFMYWSANMISDGKITGDNGMVISGFNFITGTAFGGVFGAMIKTMTGESPPSSQVSVPSTPSHAPSASTTTTSVTDIPVEMGTSSGISTVQDEAKTQTP